MELKAFDHLAVHPFETVWRSPANIAFVKYWGKKGHQIPANPSLSLTLKECVTETKLKVTSHSGLDVELFFQGKKEDRFGQKIRTYLESLQTELPWLRNTKFTVETKNTFPHGAGIASSASGLSAFALGLADFLYFSTDQKQDENFFKVASHLSRLASGSACRSVYGGFTTWGDVSDYFATPIEVHPELAHLHDSILVISAKEKSVSSRAGHERMKDHGFAEARFTEAKKNFALTKTALKAGDFETVGRILENEALQLHAMMMTSPDSFTLLRPNSLAAIEMIRDFRAQTQLPLYFTLDAGPNLHLIYPDSAKHKIATFINNELRPLCSEVIEDERGEGPVKCQ